MAEFMKIAGVKEEVAKASAPERFEADEVEALAENLRARGIIDDKGLVRHA